MNNIARDTRHDTVVALSESEEVRERIFPDWAMERVSTEDIRTVLEDALNTAEDERNVESLRRLLQHIKSGAAGG